MKFTEPKCQCLKFIGLLAIATLSGCAIDRGNEKPWMTIQSKEWLLPSFRDIYASINIQKVQKNLFILDYSFSVPVDPQKGVNPIEMHFFTYCVASKLAKQSQLSDWALGSFEKDKDLKYKDTKSLTFIVAALRKDEKAPSLGVKSNPVYWHINSENADLFFDTCSRLIKKEFMWTKQ